MAEPVVFPIRVTFGDGTTEMYEDVADIECNLEQLDSLSSPDCTVTDAKGRRLVLRVELLDLQELRLFST